MRTTSSATRCSGRSARSSSCSTRSIPVAWLLCLGTEAGLASCRTASSCRRSRRWPISAAAKGVFGDSQFRAALRNSIGIALIATLLAVRPRHVRRLRDRAPRLPRQGARALGCAGHRHVPAGRDHRARCSTCGGTLSLFDTWPGLIIPYMTFTLPLAIWTLSAFFREIPWDLDKAARVDGATPFQAFRKVIAPLAAPGMFTSAILVFIFAWNDFLFATALTSTNRARTVPAAIAFFTGASQFSFPTGQIAAASVVVTIPIIIMVLVFQRRIVAGLTSGAVKG